MYNNDLEKFKEYYKTFDSENEFIKRKYIHSLRVADLAELIAKNEGLDEEKIKVAKLAGLLHDYARFEQFTRFNDYSDVKTNFDHGDYAVKLLFEENRIKDYSLDKKYYKAVEYAIKYHNKFEIDESIKEERWLCEIIRDADKLDIFYIISNDFQKEESCEISKKVKETFFNNKTIKYADLQNESDHLILLLAFIYDFNFDFSYKYINDNKFIEKTFNQIKNKDKFKEYFEYAIVYVNNKVTE